MSRWAQQVPVWPGDDVEERKAQAAAILIDRFDVDPASVKTRVIEAIPELRLNDEPDRMVVAEGTRAD